MRQNGSRIVHAGEWITVACLLALLTGCARKPSGPSITIKWRKAKPGITTETLVRYSGDKIEVGRVVAVPEEHEGKQVSVGLHRKYAHYVSTNTVFLYVAAEGEEPGFIEALPLDEDTQPVADGAVLHGVESRTEAKVRGFVTDWKRTLLCIGVGVIVVLFGIAVARFVAKRWVPILCFAGGGAGAAYLSTPIDRIIMPLLPRGVRTDLVAYAAAFAAGFVVCAIILSMLFRRKKE